MMKIVKICTLLIFLGFVSCGEDKEKESEPAKKEVSKENKLDGFVEAEFKLQKKHFKAKIPKGAYIDDEGMVTHIYLSPDAEERMVVAPGNGTTDHEPGTFEKKGDHMFLYYGNGFICAFGPKLENSQERIEKMNDQFKLIAQTIEMVEE